MSKKQKFYTAEFKIDAIKAIESNNGNVSETAKQLRISMQTLSSWYSKAKVGTLIGTQQYSPDLVALVMMAQSLNISVSRFYDWLKCGLSKRAIQRNQQTILVKIARQ